MNTKQAFTLIELLMVISIIAILAGMAMPILTLASRAAKRQSTMATGDKIDTALKLFRAEIGSYPFQVAYAEPSTGLIPGNDLFRRLGRPIDVDDLKKVRADADKAALEYLYDLADPTNMDFPKEGPNIGTRAFRKSEVKPSTGSFVSGSIWNTDNTPKWPSSGWPWSLDNLKMGTAVMLNRMAAERARIAIFAGNSKVVGCRISPTFTPSGALYLAGRDDSTSPLLASPSSESKPGWCGDYLLGELEPSVLQEDTILDAWRQPMAYVCQVVEGARTGAAGTIFMIPTLQIDGEAYGLATTGRQTATSWDSDRRITAAPGQEYSYELWSAGPDRLFSWTRSDPANRDNVSGQPFDKTLIQ